MTPHPHGTAQRPRPPLVEWILEREAKSITCELVTRGHRAFELCVLPHWNPASAVIERFDAPLPALLRHAQVASRLRDAGWMVIDHVAAAHIDAAA